MIRVAALLALLPIHPVTMMLQEKEIVSPPPATSSPQRQTALSAPPPSAFPFLFDVGGFPVGEAAKSMLSPPIPRVQFGKVVECPHPCGLMPSFNASGFPINGGIPQLANVTLHLSIMARTFLGRQTIPSCMMLGCGYVCAILMPPLFIFTPHPVLSSSLFCTRPVLGTFATYLPNVSDDRLLDFDFEDWNPVWSRNEANGTYQNASVALVRTAHPDWTNETEIYAEAKIAFESSAKELLRTTLGYIKVLRPRIKVGMYGYPTRFYYHGYNSTNVAANNQLRAENDALFPLWCSMDAILPSVYQFYNSCENPALRESNLDYVRSTVNEAVRIGLKAATECPAVTAKAALTPSKLPVWVYTWQRYHDAVPPFVNCSADMEMFWKQSYAAGADGLILWGYEPHTQPQFQEFWTETFAPEVLAWQ